MRNYIVFYINGKRHQISGEMAFKPLSTFLRKDLALTGTKIVCGEGDCGACTVLAAGLSDIKNDQFRYQTINSCIKYLHLCDLKHFITIEGIKNKEKLSPVQVSMINYHGSQCGFCTPGFVCALSAMAEDCKIDNKPISEKKVKNYTTGNLCRCTGYKPILNAGMNIDLNDYQILAGRYHDPSMISEFIKLSKVAVELEGDQKKLFIPTTEKQASDYLSNKTIIIKLESGGTDTGVIQNKGYGNIEKVLSLDLIMANDEVIKTKHTFEIGPQATWTIIEKALAKDIPEFSNLIKIFASPQIKNTGTLVGNVANASPIGDGIPYLMVSNAELELCSSRGKRKIAVDSFYKGYKQMDMNCDEFISKLIIPIPDKKTIIKLYKISLRKDLDISAVTFAATFSLDGNKLKDVKIAYGGVGPVVLRLSDVEKELETKEFNLQNIERILPLIESGISPLSDHRGSKEYRHLIAKNLMLKCFHEVSEQVTL
jgi:xanthine dehydrogenase small subunit